jgi:hypothetical protein
VVDISCKASRSAAADTQKADRRAAGKDSSAASPGRILRGKRLPRGKGQSRLSHTAASTVPRPENSRIVARRIDSGSANAQTTSDTKAAQTKVHIGSCN